MLIKFAGMNSDVVIKWQALVMENTSRTCITINISKKLGTGLRLKLVDGNSILMVKSVISLDSGLIGREPIVGILFLKRLLF